MIAYDACVEDYVKRQKQNAEIAEYEEQLKQVGVNILKLENREYGNHEDKH